MNYSELNSELVWAFQYVEDRYLDIVFIPAGNESKPRMPASMGP